MLIKSQLHTSILSLLSAMRQRTELCDDDFAEQLATIIDAYIKSATITVPAGIPVSTSMGTGATSAPATANVK